MVLRGSPGKYYKRYVGPGQQRAMSVKIAWQVHVQHEEAKVRREMRLAAAREDQRLALANGGGAGSLPADMNAVASPKTAHKFIFGSEQQVEADESAVDAKLAAIKVAFETGVISQEEYDEVRALLITRLFIDCQ